MAKIMLVEDDNNLREIYEARLLAEGYEIISAKDGEEALALAVKEKPDLIISDVMMPKISGFDMLDILRSTAETKNTKVIMMTALSQAEDKTRADKLGADRYLVKSQVTLEDVAKVAQEVLSGEESGSTTDSIVPTPVVDTAPVAVTTPVPEPTTVPAEPVAEPVEPAPGPAIEPAVPQPAVAAPDPIATPAAMAGPEPVTPPVPGEQTAPAVSEPPASDVTGSATTDPVTTNFDTSTPVSEPSSAPEPAAESTVTTEPATSDALPAEPQTSMPSTQELPAAPPSPGAISEDLTQTTAAEEEAIEDQINAIFSDSTTTDGAATQEAVDTQPQSTDSSAMPQPTFDVPSVSAPSLTAPEEPVATPPEMSVAPAPEPAAEAPAPETKPPTQIPVNDMSGSNPQDPAVSGKKVIKPINDISKGPDFNALLQKEVANEAVPPPMPTATVMPGDATSSPDQPNANGVSPHDIAL
jgi:CheY-like chemotaxis protein